jgi:dienelactone hydrolase
VPPTPTRRSDLSGDASAGRGAPGRGRGEPRTARRRKRALASGLIATVLAAAALSVILASGGASPRRHGAAPPPTEGTTGSTTTVTTPEPVPTSFAVGLRVLRLVDSSRTIEGPNGTREPRTLTTYVRYPALGAPGRTDITNAPAATAGRPFPLVIFGHGFAVTPGLYTRLLQSWARAGYVVAAPVFPLENANAPRGPNESDLSNQPGDVRFVISRVLEAAAGPGPLAGLVDPTRIAVSGQSDGGDTALAVAYDPNYRDPRVTAAVILSGAEMPGVAPPTFPAGSPPLLATQGTADIVNAPSLTNAYFAAAPRPKYLLSLLGAEHLPPYSAPGQQLTIVEHVTLAFLDAYLKQRSTALQQIGSLGTVAGVSSLLADP